MRGDAVFLQQGLLDHVLVPLLHPADDEKTYFGEMELQRVVRAQAHIQPSFEKVREWVPFIRQK